MENRCPLKGGNNDRVSKDNGSGGEVNGRPIEQSERPEDKQMAAVAKQKKALKAIAAPLKKEIR